MAKKTIEQIAKEKDKEKVEWDAIQESWKHPRINVRGKTEYHTSYGWFTDEQIKNLQECKYFNE